MFDPETAKLIKSSYVLEGLELERLPEYLTSAYASIIESRLAITHTGGNYEQPMENYISLTKLAETYEGICLFLDHDSQHLQGSSFVAASAYYTLFKGEQTTSTSAKESLTDHSVGYELSSCLLFLCGGHQADAAETTKYFKDSSCRIKSSILNNISKIASGKGNLLSQVANDKNIKGLIPSENPSDIIYLRILQVLRDLARKILGVGELDPTLELDRIIQTIENAKNKIEIEGLNVTVSLSLAGPYHLAKLIRTATNNLLHSSVTSLTSPTDIDSEQWNDFIQNYAEERPFLWRNHQSALTSGFLEKSNSFVLTFPTGAGKTTLTELRIATEILRGRHVVVLAPTRALVSQISRSVADTLKCVDSEVTIDFFEEDFGERIGGKVFVQTPEQCLAHMLFNPDDLLDIGLIIVDEFHQISGSLKDVDHPEPSRRSVDAMLALLRLVDIAPSADLILISAMVSNGQEISDWVESITDRHSTLLDLCWKPTRQLRGVVTFDKSEIDEIKGLLKQRKSDKPIHLKGKNIGKIKNPGVNDQKDLSVTPIGLFSLTQVWEGKGIYRHFPITQNKVPLIISNQWRLSSNRNIVAGQLLKPLILSGIKPIVFSQQVDWTDSIASAAEALLEDSSVEIPILTEEENAYYIAAQEELGEGSKVFTPVGGKIGIHHGLLLPSERLATESAFKRENGLLALVATPTVAQGINLPAEAVIIAGDTKFDGDSDSMETLAVHELLNAAGRAGRAGHFAQGIVIDVPGWVFTMEQTDHEGIKYSGYEHVMSLFGEEDKCLNVTDPVTQAIDYVQHYGHDTDLADCIVQKFRGLDAEKIEDRMSKCLGYFNKKENKYNQENQLATLSSLILATEKEDSETTAKWGDLAMVSGVSPLALSIISESIPSLDQLAQMKFSDLLKVYLELICSEGTLFSLIHPLSSGLETIVPQGNQTSTEWQKQWSEILYQILPLWISGVPLGQIGSKLKEFRGGKGRPTSDTLARRFAIRTTSSLAYAASIISSVIEHKYEDQLGDDLKTTMKYARSCIKEGLNNMTKLLLFRVASDFPVHQTRVRVHRIYEMYLTESFILDTLENEREQRQWIRDQLESVLSKYTI